MINIKNIKKHYSNNFILSIDSFTILEKEKIGIIGENGSGKTTFLRSILDLTELDDGFIEIDSVKINANDSWKDNVSAYLDTSFLIEFVSIKNYFYFLGLDYQNHIDILTKFGLKDFINTEIKTLSSGQMKKVGLIGALLRKTKIKIFDEPTSFLDFESISALIQYIKDDLTSTYIFTEHNYEFINKCSSRIIKLNRGTILKD